MLHIIVHELVWAGTWDMQEEVTCRIYDLSGISAMNNHSSEMNSLALDNEFRHRLFVRTN